jgi:hypothetical protein
MFGHKQIWDAFEAIAKRCGMSLSALSKSAGLDPTSFNPSKRYGPGGRERWPSTETLSRVLHVANMDMRAFADILDARSGAGAEGQKPSRRQSKRLLSILEGRIRLEPQAPQVSCTVRNLSATGARIWLPGRTELPHEFELEIPSLGQALKVRLIWSRARSHGVMFLEAFRPSSGGDVARLLDALHTPDDETYLDDALKGSAPASQTAGKHATHRRKRWRLPPRKLG